MQIAIGSDAAGFPLKEVVAAFLQQQGIDVLDVGIAEPVFCDYTDIAVKCISAFSSKNCTFAILICGTGIGVSMVANKFRGVRAALCYTPECAQLAREHNDANVLCLGGRITSEKAAIATIKAFLSTKASEVDRHVKRVNDIQLIEEKHFK